MRASTKRQTRREAGAQSPRASHHKRQPGRRREKIALSESRMTLMLTLISIELSCALLWALSGTFAAGALALTLGLGAVLAVFLPERYPLRGELPRKPARLRSDRSSQQGGVIPSRDYFGRVARGRSPGGGGHRTGPPEGETCEGGPDKDTLRIGRIVG
jgi:hypothetical protein